MSVEEAYERSMKLAGDNQGAALILSRLIEAGHEDLLDQLEKRNLTGWRLWLAYRYVCGEDLERLVSVLSQQWRSGELESLVDMADAVIRRGK